MRTNRIAFITFITLASVAFVTVVQTLPPSPLPADAPATIFSAERAIQHIQVIAAQPRLPGSVAYEAAQNYILAELENMGLKTETQNSAVVQNIIGWIEGFGSSDTVLLVAHLDSKGGPGATDDGSGIAILLETARALMSNAPLQNTVMLLFTGIEEGGYFGARAFIDQHPWARNVRVVINFDAGGISGPGILSATSANNGWLIKQFAYADPYIVGSSAINALAYSYEDFSGAFRPAGFSGYAFSLYWDKRIHTPADNIENLNPSSIQHQGYHALSLARHFGNLTSLTDPKIPDAVFFNVLRLCTVRYSPAWAIAIAIAVTVVFSGVLVYGLRKRILSWGGIGYGVFALVVGLMIAPLSNVLLGKWISGIASQIVDPSLVQPLQVSVIVLIALAFTMLWYLLSRRIRNTSISDLTIGALVPMEIGMLGTSLAFPALSYAFTWPLLFNLLASTNWFYFHAHQKNLKIAILGSLFSSATSIVILGQGIILGLFDQISLTLVFLGILCGFLVQPIHLMLGIMAGNNKAFSTL